MTIESYWPGLFAKLFGKKSLDTSNVIMNMGAGGGGAAVAVSAPAAEEKKVT